LDRLSHGEKKGDFGFLDEIGTSSVTFLFLEDEGLTFDIDFSKVMASKGFELAINKKY